MAIYNFEDNKPKKNKADYQKISGIICVGVSLLALFCLITHFVPFVKSFLLGAFGLFCYPFFITALAIGFALIGHKKYVMPKKYGIYLGLSIVFVLCILQLILVSNDGLTFWEYIGRCYTQKTTAGGVVLGFVSACALYTLNRLGAYIIFIALALIFIALTVDYIHYLSKNENLKKAVKVADTSKDMREGKITVKQLEKSLNIKTKEEKQKQEKVKLTLDAKEADENPEEIAKRKLGLLASSKTDEEDNSRYFANESKSAINYENKIDNPKEYILASISNNLRGENQTDAKLSRIQQNLMELKSKNNLSSYPISNSTKDLASTQGAVISSLNVNEITNNARQTSFETYKQNNNSLPDRVVHDDVAPILSPSQPFNLKSTMEDDANETNNEKPMVSIIEEEDFKPSFNLKESLDSENLDVDQIKEVNISNQNSSNSFVSNSTINEKNINTLDVENFSNSVLASLKAERRETVSYNTPQKTFEEEVSVVEPIVPKTPANYVKPPIDLLTTESMDLSTMNEDVVMKREELEMALDTFGIPAKVIGVVIGPAVTRYELEMPAGVSIKKLIALQEDIAYNLSSNGDIRIEAPIPGRRAVGIEVPNERVATVGLRDIILSREYMEARAPLTIALGKDISGMVKTFSLVKIPHLLVAGTTGSGKSVCINSIIMSLIYKYSPDDVKLILVDPKRVEFSMYNHLPHLLMPNVITDSEKALNALSWCADEMDRRYIVFANARVKNLEEYNESEEVLEGKAEKMPYIIFIIDELADLLMTSKKEAEEYICRILQKARASGIHMILATQRPSVDVVTGKIKANLNARICFALMTFGDSKTVLDQGGADKLLGKGDMLFLSSDTGNPKRIQGCFVSTKEIDDVVTFIKENNGDYEFDIKTEQAIINPPKKDVISQIDGDRASSDGFDALMPQILKFVIENGHASISMIQRKFLVGFPRAARIIDQMEQAGYISPSDGSKSRSVYISMEEYENLYGEG